MDTSINCGSSMIEYNNVIYERYLYYKLKEKQYDISGGLLCNPGDFYELNLHLIKYIYTLTKIIIIIYLQYILLQKQYDISVSLLCNPRDFCYLHYILIENKYDISGSLLCNPGDFYYRQDIKM